MVVEGGVVLEGRKGRDGSGWSNCFCQMRRLVKHLEHKGAGGSRNGGLVITWCCCGWWTISMQRRWKGKGTFR
jgi:hypothetical protein